MNRLFLLLTILTISQLACDPEAESSSDAGSSTPRQAQGDAGSGSDAGNTAADSVFGAGAGNDERDDDRFEDIQDTCGDSIRHRIETCDDGNTMSGDGCSDRCLIEEGFRCLSVGEACEEIVVEVPTDDTPIETDDGPSTGSGAGAGGGDEDEDLCEDVACENGFTCLIRYENYEYAHLPIESSDGVITYCEQNDLRDERNGKIQYFENGENGERVEAFSWGESKAGEWQHVIRMQFILGDGESFNFFDVSPLGESIFKKATLILEEEGEDGVVYDFVEVDDAHDNIYYTNLSERPKIATFLASAYYDVFKATLLIVR